MKSKGASTATPQGAQFDQYSSSYDLTVNSALSISPFKVDYFTKVKAAYLRELAAKELGPTETLRAIDIGCGVGNLHALITPPFRSLTGVDVSAECLAAARERNPQVEYGLFDGRRLPYESKSFDLAFAICVFHHIAPRERGELIQEIRRTLRRGGVFALFEHNPINPLTRHIVSNCEFDKDAILLSCGAAERLLREHRFVNVRSTYILTIPALGKIARAVDRKLGLLRLGAQYVTQGRAD